MEKIDGSSIGKKFDEKLNRLLGQLENARNEKQKREPEIKKEIEAAEIAYQTYKDKQLLRKGAKERLQNARNELAGLDEKIEDAEKAIKEFIAQTRSEIETKIEKVNEEEDKLKEDVEKWVKSVGAITRRRGITELEQVKHAKNDINFWVEQLKRDDISDNERQDYQKELDKAKNNYITAYTQAENDTVLADLRKRAEALDKATKLKTGKGSKLVAKLTELEEIQVKLEAMGIDIKDYSEVENALQEYATLCEEVKDKFSGEECEVEYGVFEKIFKRQLDEWKTWELAKLSLDDINAKKADLKNRVKVWDENVEKIVFVQKALKDKTKDIQDSDDKKTQELDSVFGSKLDDLIARTEAFDGISIDVTSLLQEIQDYQFGKGANQLQVEKAELIRKIEGFRENLKKLMEAKNNGTLNLDANKIAWIENWEKFLNGRDSSVKQSNPAADEATLNENLADYLLQNNSLDRFEQAAEEFDKIIQSLDEKRRQEAYDKAKAAYVNDFANDPKIDTNSKEKALEYLDKTLEPNVKNTNIPTDLYIDRCEQYIGELNRVKTLANPPQQLSDDEKNKRKAKLEDAENKYYNEFDKDTNVTPKDKKDMLQKLTDLENRVEDVGISTAEYIKNCEDYISELEVIKAAASKAPLTDEQRRQEAYDKAKAAYESDDFINNTNIDDQVKVDTKAKLKDLADKKDDASITVDDYIKECNEYINDLAGIKAAANKKKQPQKIEVKSISVDVKNGIYTFEIDGWAKPLTVDINKLEAETERIKNETGIDITLTIKPENIMKYTTGAIDGALNNEEQIPNRGVVDFIVAHVLGGIDEFNRGISGDQTDNANQKKYLDFLHPEGERQKPENVISIVYDMQGDKKANYDHINGILKAAKKARKTSMVENQSEGRLESLKNSAKNKVKALKDFFFRPKEEQKAFPIPGEGSFNTARYESCLNAVNNAPDKETKLDKIAEAITKNGLNKGELDAVLNETGLKAEWEARAAKPQETGKKKKKKEKQQEQPENPGEPTQEDKAKAEEIWKRIELIVGRKAQEEAIKQREDSGMINENVAKLLREKVEEKAKKDIEPQMGLVEQLENDFKIKLQILEDKEDGEFGIFQKRIDRLKNKLKREGSTLQWQEEYKLTKKEINNLFETLRNNTIAEALKLINANTSLDKIEEQTSESTVKKLLISIREGSCSKEDMKRITEQIQIVVGLEAGQDDIEEKTNELCGKLNIDPAVIARPRTEGR